MQQTLASPDGPSGMRQALIDTTREWGYFDIDPGLKEKVRNKRILDVGMGGGPYAVAYVESGAAAYAGVDPLAGSDHVRDHRSTKDSSFPAYHAFPFSIQDIELLYPNVKIYPATLDRVAREVKATRPNFATMSSVTEHLEHPDKVLHAIWEVLDRDGTLWATHHGYHSWSGHHALPRDVGSWDRTNPAHNAVVDWKHLDPDHPRYASKNMNRIRLEDMRLVVAKYFELQYWEPVIEGRAVSRLTPDIRRRWRKYSLAELLTRTVLIVGKRRDVPLDIDFKDRQLFHPDEDYQADRDYLHEDIAPYTLAHNRVYFFQGDKVVSHSTNDFAALKVFARLKAGDALRVTKGGERHTFTVAEILHPAGSAPHVLLTEPVPEPLREANYSNWTIEL